MQGLCLSVKSPILQWSVWQYTCASHLQVGYFNGNKHRWAKHVHLLYAVCTLELNHAMHSPSWHAVPVQRSAMPAMRRTQGSENKKVSPNKQQFDILEPGTQLQGCAPCDKILASCD